MGYYNVKLFWDGDRPKEILTGDGVYLLPILDKYHSTESYWGKQAYVYAPDDTAVFVEEALFLVEQLREDQSALQNSLPARTFVASWSARPDPRVLYQDAESSLWFTIGRGTLGSGVNTLFQDGRHFSTLNLESCIKGGTRPDITTTGLYRSKEDYDTWVHYVMKDMQEYFWEVLDSLRHYTRELGAEHHLVREGVKYVAI
jgi:hypothetical protein